MRLIDADALPRMTQIYEFNGKRMEKEVVSARFIDIAPTIDAVPIVRCKDCIYYDNLCRCDLLGIPMERLNFCSYGERRNYETI